MKNDNKTLKILYLELGKVIQKSKISNNYIYFEVVYFEEWILDLSM